jgi:hypothetical protein
MRIKDGFAGALVEGVGVGDGFVDPSANAACPKTDRPIAATAAVSVCLIDMMSLCFA